MLQIRNQNAHLGSSLGTIRGNDLAFVEFGNDGPDPAQSQPSPGLVSLVVNPYRKFS
jgi:hypothetical protein